MDLCSWKLYIDYWNTCHTLKKQNVKIRANLSQTLACERWPEVIKKNIKKVFKSYSATVRSLEICHLTISLSHIVLTDN